MNQAQSSLLQGKNVTEYFSHRKELINDKLANREVPISSVGIKYSTWHMETTRISTLDFFCELVMVLLFIYSRISILGDRMITAIRTKWKDCNGNKYKQLFLWFDYYFDEMIHWLIGSHVDQTQTRNSTNRSQQSRRKLSSRQSRMMGSSVQVFEKISSDISPLANLEELKFNLALQKFNQFIILLFCPAKMVVVWIVE
jgi:hypothetical protein